MIPAAKKPARKRAPSAIEESFAFQCKVLKLPLPQREYRFAPPRMWRFDFAWPDRMIAVEIEGGIWTGGRHTRADGFEKDCEKYNAAALAGWRIFRFSGGMLRSSAAVRLIETALESERT